jgi:hypothetical protein
LPSRSAIVERICRDADIPELADVLADRLPGTDLQSLLLEVFRARSPRRSAVELLAQRGRDATVAPAPVDARRVHEVERLALRAADRFDAVALAPVSPLGLNTVLGGIDQNNALATVRGTEALADPTTALSLEAALRRRDGQRVVRLCSVDRVLRLQPFPGEFTPHFGLFSLVTAGRSRAGHEFELEALREHVAIYLRLLAALAEQSYRTGSTVVEVGGRRDRLELVESAVFEPLQREFPHAALRLAPERRRAARYYDGLMLEVFAGGQDEAPISVADGGSTDWTQRLLSDRKERLLVSGIGTEMLARFLAPG